jgi:hypothetical protein
MAQRGLDRSEYLQLHLLTLAEPNILVYAAPNNLTVD